MEARSLNQSQSCSRNQDHTKGQGHSWIQESHQWLSWNQCQESYQGSGVEPDSGNSARGQTKCQSQITAPKVKPESGSSAAEGQEFTQLLGQLPMLPSGLSSAFEPIGGARHLLQSGALWVEPVVGLCSTSSLLCWFPRAVGWQLQFGELRAHVQALQSLTSEYQGACKKENILFLKNYLK